jgi:hypothetical protein
VNAPACNARSTATPIRWRGSRCGASTTATALSHLRGALANPLTTFPILNPPDPTATHECDHEMPDPFDHPPALGLPARPTLPIVDTIWAQSRTHHPETTQGGEA